jgi:hypothetical protein
VKNDSSLIQKLFECQIKIFENGSFLAKQIFRIFFSKDCSWIISAISYNCTKTKQKNKLKALSYQIVVSIFHILCH